MLARSGNAPTSIRKRRRRRRSVCRTCSDRLSRPSRARIVGGRSKAERVPASAGVDARPTDEGESVRAVLTRALERQRSDHADVGVDERVGRLVPHDDEVAVRAVRLQRVLAHPIDLRHGRAARTRVDAAAHGVLEAVARALEVVDRDAPVPLAAGDVEAHVGVGEGRQHEPVHLRPPLPVLGRRLPLQAPVDRRPSRRSSAPTRPGTRC